MHSDAANTPPLPPEPRFSGESLRTHAASEWVLTNGLGGFAMGTVSGTPERKYHALLVAATNPPVGRVATLQAVDEAIAYEVVDTNGTPIVHRHALSTFCFPGSDSPTPLHPSLAAFTRSACSCRWDYSFNGPTNSVHASRELAIAQAVNAGVVRYETSGYQSRAWLELRPLISIRDFHRVLSEREGVDRYHIRVMGDQARRPSITISADGLSLTLHVSHPSRFIERRDWWRSFQYRRDKERGDLGVEDLFCPGVFLIELQPSPGDVELSFGIGDAPAPTLSTIRNDARLRWNKLSAQAGQTPATPPPPVRAPAADHDDAIIASLRLAADQFIVARTTPPSQAGPSAPAHDPAQSSIIAGYPWFSDWGRDSMISLRGLLLCTGRFQEARSVLEAFASRLRDGLIPNCFDESTGRPVYNSVDAPLWFIQAACDYLEHSRDRASQHPLLATCFTIVDAFERATAFDIGIDPADGLVRAGSPQTQLTWMDARRDGVVFTPRHGKAVEISALWCSGLVRLAQAASSAMPRESRHLLEQASRAGAAFRARFWDDSRTCLYDTLRPGDNGDWEPVAELRPNQIFAVSLPHSPLTIAQQRGVLRTVRDQLLTPMGLRTLGPADPAYRPRFEGSLFERDRAYHNGTVWPWLIGPFAEAVLRADGFSSQARIQARQAIDPLCREFMGLGANPPPSVSTLCEVYDAEDEPDRPRRGGGCMAQAWSIAELLRVFDLLRRA